MKLLKKIKFICFIIFLFIVFTSYAQVINVNGYEYSLNTTKLSREEALKTTIFEALNNCVQENIGINVLGLTQSSQYEDNDKFRERFSDFTLQISMGFVKSYEITDTVQICKEYPIIETTIKLNVTLTKPKKQNPLGLYADINKNYFKENEKAEITYSVKVPAYLYFLTLTAKDSILVLYETNNKIPANKVLKFPDPVTNYSIVMVKEIDDDYEFGSFIVFATTKFLNFPAIKKHITGEGYEKLKIFSYQQFHVILTKNSKEYSLQYLPYCIE